MPDPINIGEKRQEKIDDLCGDWLGGNPLFADIVLRLLKVAPSLGTDAPESIKRPELNAAVACGAVTWNEIALYDRAILLAKERFADTAPDTAPDQDSTPGKLLTFPGDAL